MSDFDSNGLFNDDNRNDGETDGYVAEPQTNDEVREEPVLSFGSDTPQETPYVDAGANSAPQYGTGTGSDFVQPPVRPQYPYGNTSYTGQTDNVYNPNPVNSQPQNNGYNQTPFNGGYTPQNNGYTPPNPYSYSNNSANNGYAYQQNNDNENKPSKKNGGKIFLIIAVVLLVTTILAVAVGLVSSNKSTTETETEATEAQTELNVEEFSSNSTPETKSTTTSDGVLTSKEVYEKVKESSVGILVYDSTKSLSSEGTGVVMTEDKDGKYTYIVTCAHVISDSNVSIMVQLYSGKEYSAQIVGYDSKTDIGVLRIEQSGLKVAEFGDSSKLSVGDNVYAIGNPGGTEFANSFTNGMISAIDRPVSSSSTGYTMECIQHTAAINPGNSGGALVNEYGQVIGINSMKIISDEYEGMGFAVPSSVFIDIVNEIIENGYVSNRPKLGITYVSASNQQSYAMYVAIKGLPSGSIIIYSISEDSDLVNTDAQKGDLIVAVNGVDLDDASDLSEIIENSNVGDTITLSIVRINDDYTSESFDVKVKLVEDRGDDTVEEEEEESSTSIYDYFYNGGNGSSGYGNGGYSGGYGSSSDDFEDFFNEYFGSNP